MKKLLFFAAILLSMQGYSRWITYYGSFRSLGYGTNTVNWSCSLSPAICCQLNVPEGPQQQGRAIAYDSNGHVVEDITFTNYETSVGETDTETIITLELP